MDTTETGQGPLVWMDQDRYDALQATIAAQTQRISELELDKAELQGIAWELEAELAEARKPMRLVVQPDFEIDLEDQ